MCEKRSTKNLIEIAGVTKEEIERLFLLADQAKAGKLENTLTDKIIASCFFEASTRTRLSFESAIYRLGAKVIGFSDSKQTSFGQKGESLEDTIVMLNAYADAIIMRHPEKGSAKLAASVSDIPVINAGDGANEHPTQTLLDLYTIQEKFSDIDGLKIAMVGDLKYGRTVHSLSYALAHFNNIEIYYVAPESLQIPAEISQKLSQQGVKVHKRVELEEVISEVNVLYMTRLQQERFEGDELHQFEYRLTREMLERSAKDELIVLHPLPRVKEISPDVDATDYAWYFKQAKNGVYMRQAILYNLFNIPC
ncbi:aspartate carbamoyltransferase [Fangia hongkongensis]|uniref:aspartate carbamoyltransferase n=1 Tax=Fangia hongkongensis TaxID=270495 RepID=UPI0003683912|nr:aspartate carbamoyltransferase [Fangia hongkongensis]MBK2125235.1 aspartate carbamoyltransferase [Fangia hongkongensis]